MGPPNIVTVCKAFVYWVELWNGSGSSTCRTDGKIVPSDRSISLDTWSQRQAQRHRRSDRPGIQVGCRDLARNNATTVGAGWNGTEEIGPLSRSATEVDLVILVAEACHAYRILTWTMLAASEAGKVFLVAR